MSTVDLHPNVKRQKVEILRALDRDDLARVWSLVDQLVAYPLGHDGPHFAVKSLCDLAKEAQRRGNVDAQVELTGRAVTLGPHDSYAWTQRGKALLNVRRLPEALDACDRGLADDWVLQHEIDYALDLS